MGNRNSRTNDSGATDRDSTIIAGGDPAVIWSTVSVSHAVTSASAHASWRVVVMGFGRLNALLKAPPDTVVTDLSEI